MAAERRWKYQYYIENFYKINSIGPCFGGLILERSTIGQIQCLVNGSEEEDPFAGASIVKACTGSIGTIDKIL
jgi:hypothetical protein